MARTRLAGHGISLSAWFGSCLRVATMGLLLGAGACGVKKTADVSPGTGGTGGAGGAGATATGGAGLGGTTALGGASGTPQKLVILHTNDMHSHLVGHSPERDYTPATLNDDSTRGGMARLATAIGAAKLKAAAAGTPVMLLDAGDFMMGSLFELLAKQEVPELVFMQALGYDATTVGNHELDWTPLGLAAILQAATKKGVTLPILASNMNFSVTDTGDDALEALAAANVLTKKLVKTVGGLKVGLFGLLGSDAVTVTPQAAPLTFDKIDVAALRMVTELRTVDKVDLVIALSHSGIDSAGKGEDAMLAAAVPGIDIIISGHTHDTLAAPAKVGNTLIVTAGAYISNLGQLELTVTPSGTPGGSPTVALDGYTPLDIDDKIPGDATTQAAVEQYIAGLDAAALVPQGLAYKKVVAKTPMDLALPAFAEAPVGNLVTDAYKAIVTKLQMTDPPVLAVEANGQLRSPILKGKTGEIWFADLFRVLPIGIGPDQVPGFPLVTFYLNAKDIRSGLELGGAPELVPDQYFLQVSGLKVEYDMTKNIFGRVSSLKLGDKVLDPTDTTTCYKIVATNYVAGLLGVVKSFTHEALSVEAKDADCKTLIDPTTRFVDADPATAGVQELKHWQALLKYVQAFPDASTPPDGIPDVPAAYGAVQGRITKK